MTTKSEAETPKGTSIFYGTITEWEEFDVLRRSYLKYTQESTSIRLAVLETWVLIDYLVRGLLMTGLDMHNVDHEDLDLRYTLLPRSFKECVTLVRKIWTLNKDLPAKPEPRLRALLRQWEFFEEFDNGMFERFKAAEKAYCLKFNIPQSTIFEDLFRYQTVEDGWLEVAGRIDATWQSGADRLNNTRNLAAHCHDEARIASKLGCYGPHALSLGIAECQKLAQVLIGIDPAEGPSLTRFG